MAPLERIPPRLSREGYIRALEVYGCEDNLRNSLKSKVSLFNKWRKQNPGDLELYRSYANSLGYDWLGGSVTEDGLYTSLVRATAPGGPPMYDFNNPPSFEDPSGRPGDISLEIQAEDVRNSVGEESMTSDPNGRFAAMNGQQANSPTSSHVLHNRTVNFQTPESTPRSLTVFRSIPLVLQGAPGNLQFVPGEDQKNALGAASIAYVALTMLRGMADGSEEITTDERADIKAMLNYVSEEDMKKFVKGFQPDLAS